MKTVFTLFFFLTFFFSKAQITIEATDIPIPDETFRVFAGPVPSLQNDFNNKVWNYSNIIPTEMFPVNFPKEEIPDFVAAGIDVYRSVTKQFNANFNFFTDIEIDFNENGVVEKGMYVEEQRYGLSPFTGNNKDSLIIPRQGYIYSDVVQQMKFPFTNQSSWSSIGRRYIDFTISVTAFNLNNIPARMVWYVNRKDTIIGFGKMSIYTEQGPSKSYDVLVDRINLSATDSFYLGGQPAPPAILNGFEIQQGQKTNLGNRINFYRKGMFMYLASFFYGGNTFSTQPIDFFMCDHDAELATSSKDEDKELFSVALYPNIVSQGDKLNVYISDKNLLGNTYIIYDINGKEVTSGQFVPGQDIDEISLPAFMAPGTYFFTAKTNNAKMMITEKFVVR